MHKSKVVVLKQEGNFVLCKTGDIKFPYVTYRLLPSGNLVKAHRHLNLDAAESDLIQRGQGKELDMADDI